MQKAKESAPRDIQPQWTLTPAEMRLAEKLEIEDGKPVDGERSEKQMRLLTEPLYTSWKGGAKRRLFLAAANVGIFFAVKKPPIVPDVFLSMDIKQTALKTKAENTYFYWDRKKPLEVAIEIVSNKRGGEKTHKRDTYASIGIKYYVIFDPFRRLGSLIVERFVLVDGVYHPQTATWMEEVGLSLVLWEGAFEGLHDIWLRWGDEKGVVIPTGEESTASMQSEVARLRQLLKSKGIDPNDKSNGKSNGKH